MKNQSMSVDRKDLKIQALLEKITALTTQYENQSADFRVEITVLSNEIDNLRRALAEAHGTDDVQEADTATD